MAGRDLYNENGSTYEDVINHEGNIEDFERRSYLTRHLAAVKEAVRKGIRLKATSPGVCWTTLNGPKAISAGLA